METHGNEQAHAVADMMRSATTSEVEPQGKGCGVFQDVTVVKDYGKVDRFVLGFKQSRDL